MRLLFLSQGFIPGIMIPLPPESPSHYPYPLFIPFIMVPVLIDFSFQTDMLGCIIAKIHNHLDLWDLRPKP